jgi:hypothetical protein
VKSKNIIIPLDIYLVNDKWLNELKEYFYSIQFEKIDS